MWLVDPLGAQHATTTINLQAWLVQEGRAGNKTVTFSDKNYQKFAVQPLKQPNGFGCGLYLTQFIYVFLSGPESVIERLTEVQEVIPKFAMSRLPILTSGI
jgi:Ulp1 family protease